MRPICNTKKKNEVHYESEKSFRGGVKVYLLIKSMNGGKG